MFRESELSVALTRRVVIAAGVLLLIAAVSVVLVIALAQRVPAIAQVDRITKGMSQDEVAAILGPAIDGPRPTGSPKMTFAIWYLRDGFCSIVFLEGQARRISAIPAPESTMIRCRLERMLERMLGLR